MERRRCDRYGFGMERIFKDFIYQTVYTSYRSIDMMEMSKLCSYFLTSFSYNNVRHHGHKTIPHNKSINEIHLSGFHYAYIQILFLFHLLLLLRALFFHIFFASFRCTQFRTHAYMYNGLGFFFLHVPQRR